VVDDDVVVVVVVDVVIDSVVDDARANADLMDNQEVCSPFISRK
jgi:hypothetical protein